MSSFIRVFEEINESIMRVILLLISSLSRGEKTNMTIELFQVEAKAVFLSRYRWEIGTVFPTLT
jgi:hypothetical protein